MGGGCKAGGGVGVRRGWREEPGVERRWRDAVGGRRRADSRDWLVVTAFVAVYFNRCGWQYNLLLSVHSRLLHMSCEQWFSLQHVPVL